MLLLCLSSYAQVDSSKLFFFKKENNLYYCIGNNGLITTKSKAAYYRIVQLPLLSFPFGTKVIDQYTNGDTAFIGTLKSGVLDGPATYFHRNGKMSISASFKEGNRHDTWQYYYPDGQLRMTIQYAEESFYILQSFSKKGKHLVVDGTGKYSYTLPKKMPGSIPYKMKGHVKDSLLDGRWTVGPNFDIFENGKFISGWGVVLDLLVGQTIHEAIYDLSPKAYAEGFANTALYKYEHDLNYFLSDYKAYLEDELPILNNLKNSWIIVSFSISKKGILENMSVLSNDQRVSNLTGTFLWDTHWLASKSVSQTQRNIKIDSPSDPGISDIEEIRYQIEFPIFEDEAASDQTVKSVECYIFFPALVLDKEVYVPEFKFFKKVEYIYE